MFQEDMIASIILVLFFYLLFEILIPELNTKKNKIYLFLSIITLIAIITWLPRELAELINFGEYSYKQQARPDKIIPNGPAKHPPHWIIINGKFILEFLIVFFIAYIIRLNQKLKDVTEEKLKAQLSFLKAQINPHFLFNTLNSIYSLAITKSDETPDAIIKLSGMMRYVITETTNDFVDLEKEIEYAINYIDLQKIRCNNTVEIKFQIEGKTDKKKIAPLILIPFIENAFKHGISTEEKSIIEIDIKIDDASLQMRVYNKKHSTKKHEKNEKKLGVKTTINRLNLIYADRHTLNITNNETDYTILLKIEL